MQATKAIPQVGDWVQTPNGIAQVHARQRNRQTGKCWLLFAKDLQSLDNCRPLPAQMPQEWLDDACSMVESAMGNPEACKAIKAVLSEAFPRPEYKQQIWDALTPEEKNELKGAS